MEHFTDRLNRLMNTSQVPGTTRSYSQADLVREMERKGHPLSRSYASKLCNGEQDNPSGSVIAALAAVFDVPVAYFFDEEVAAKVDAELDRRLEVTSVETIRV